jgi:lysophospholipase L1-like esterase
VTPPNKVTVYLIGDSTMSVKSVSAYPETGWGMPFAHFFDETVTVDNRAQNGRSTRTFIEENRWQPVVDSLREGDYVFIQFGHNDEVVTKKSYTTESAFTANLLRFVTESRNRKAIPVLITPVARRKFDATGNIEGTHTIYANLVRKVAADSQTPLIDLDTQSQQLLQQLGVDNSTMLFLHLAPNEHPNYPEGKEDNTHFNELGARRVAEIVLANIRLLKLDLVDRVRKPVKTK